MEIIFCERKKLKVKDFALFVANIYALSRKISKIQRRDNGKKLFCGALPASGTQQETPDTAPTAGQAGDPNGPQVCSAKYHNGCFVVFS